MESDSVFSKIAQFWKSIFIIILPLALSPLLMVADGDGKVEKCAFVALLMAFSWMMELLPLAVTSLIPVALFPVMSIMSTEDVSMQYLNKTCMLFVGGLILAAAVEHVDLHKRIALNVMNVVGTSPRMLILSFMLPTAFLSMWISNTATTAMMIPIMEAVLSELEDTYEAEDKASKKKVRSMLAMSVCFGANIGGTGTTIGTGPNLVLLNNLDKFTNHHPLTFGTWMAFAVPIEVVCLIFLWLWLQFYYLPLPWSKGRNEAVEAASSLKISRMIKDKCRELGPLCFREAAVLTLFSVLVLLWLLRSPGFFDGYGDLIGLKIEDASPAIAIVLILFLLPAEPTFLRLKRCDKPLIDWRTAEKRLPWGIIILLGGGFALAEGSDRSGLNDWIGSQLDVLSDLPPFVILLLVCIIASVLTQVASNVASAAILLPIMAQLSCTTQVNPLTMMLPPTLITSFAFMLPVSTPPNAIAFEPSGMKTVEMMKVGFVMNIICLCVTLTATYTYGIPLLGLDEFPDWATENCGNSTRFFSHSS